jgi:hypothetical protein
VMISYSRSPRWKWTLQPVHRLRPWLCPATTAWRTSRQDAALDESTKLCSDGGLGYRDIAILATSTDGESHAATHPDGPLAKPHTRFTCRVNSSVQIGGREAGGPKPAHRRHEIHQGDDSCRLPVSRLARGSSSTKLTGGGAQARRLQSRWQVGEQELTRRS